jgi:hypothetical protein
MRRIIATTGVLLVLGTLLFPGTANAGTPGRFASLQATIDTTTWSPNSTDPAGMTYWASKGRFIVVDSEVEEIVCDKASGAPGANYISAGGVLTGNCTADHALTYYKGVNTYEMNSAGTVLRTSDTSNCPIPQTSGTACTGFTWEPTDVAASGNRVFMTDDNKDTVFVIDVGPDGDLNTADDVRTSFSTRAFNDYDPEGVGYDPTTGTLLVTSGVFNQVYRIAPGANGVFDGTDDQVSCMDAGRLGMRDPEDVAVDPTTGTFYLSSHATDHEIAAATPNGELSDLIDTNASLPWSTAPEIGLGGIAIGPSSDDPNRNDLFLAARGLDNNDKTLPGGNDGKIYELKLNAPTTNRAPIVSTPGNQFSIEGESVRLQIVARDPNGDNLTYSILPNTPPGTRSLLPPGLSIDPSTGLISGTIAAGASTGGNAVDSVTGAPTPDTYRVSVHVVDTTTGATNRVITRWKIYPSASAYVADTANGGFPFNAPPTISSPGNQTSAEGDAVNLQLSASDPENGTTVNVGGQNYAYRLMYSSTGLPPGLSLNCTTGAITGTVAPGAAGTYQARVMVEDQTTAESTDFRSKWDAAKLTWTVNPAGPVNQSPSVTNPGNQQSAEGSQVSLQISATDPEADAMTYSATGLPPGLSIDQGTGLITGTVSAGASASSPYSVTVTANDGHSNGSASFSWTVPSGPVNQSPSVTNPGNQQSIEGNQVNLQISATDPEVDPMTYSATGLPPGLSIAQGTGLITGTVSATASASSPYSVTVTANDGHSNGSASFSWTVLSGRPVVTKPSNQSTVEGNAANLQVVANDPNGDPLTYSATGLPPGLSIAQGTGLITGTVSPGASASSPYSVTVTANDGHSNGSAGFSWTVLSGRPVVTAPSNQTSTEGDAVNLQVVANDPNGDTLSYSATGLPPGLSIDPSTGLITGTITPGPGAETPTYNVQVSASDGTLSGNKSFTWSVTAKVRFRSSAETTLAKDARTITIAKPAGVATNDLLVAGITVDGTPASLTAPAGWTLAMSHTSGAMKQFVYTKVAGNEPVSYAFGLPTATQATAIIAAYSGVNTTTPLGPVAGMANAASANIAAPSVNGTAGQMLVALFGNLSNGAITQPNGMIERAEALGSGTSKVSLEISDDHLAATGATGTRTATTTLGAKKGVVSVGQVLILNPA